jgi:anaerobic magnesium-protoporphyrin IX monomethyl ester cyclase
MKGTFILSDILLIAPGWGHIYGRFQSLSRRFNFQPPLGLCYLASALKSAGHRTIIVDAEAQGLDTETVAKEALAHRWDAIGISATTPIYPAAVSLAKNLKKIFQGPVLLGGPHATIVREEAFDSSGCFDYIVCGEAEQTIVSLMNALASGGEISKIPGLVIREGNNVRFTGNATREKNLDDIIFPDRTDLQPQNYLWSVPKHGLVPTTSVMFSRGCPFECTFCAQDNMYGRTVRYRSTENMLREFEDIIAGTRFRHFIFNDDSLTVKRQRLVELAQGIIKRGFHITFECETRANLLDRELVSLMHEAGLVRINIGIESGDPEILKKLKAGITLEDVKTSLRLLKSFGIETRGSVIIGAPYERRETVLRTLRFIADLKDLDQPYVNIAAPYPGTAMREMALHNEGGTRLLSADYGSLIRYGSAIMEVNDLTAADLVRLQRWGLRRAYMRPRRLWYNVKRAGFRAGFLNGIAFLKSTMKTGGGAIPK